MNIWEQLKTHKIKHSTARHLVAVFHLRKQNGYARISDVARYLKATVSNASINVKLLRERGLVIEDKNRVLHLSETGQQLAKGIIAKRSIFTVFLETVLGVNSAQAEIDTNQVEHLLSPEANKRMLLLMHALNKNPKLAAELRNQIDSMANLNFCPWINGTDKDAQPCSVCEERCLLNNPHTTRT